MNSDTHIDKQETGLLAKTKHLNAAIDRLNVILKAEGKDGIKVQFSDANMVISLDREEVDKTIDMWVCQIIGGVPTPVLFRFHAEEVVD